jgi:hypothetical protein
MPWSSGGSVISLQAQRSLHSRQMLSISSVERSSAPKTTASWLPPKAVSVNTSVTTYESTILRGLPGCVDTTLALRRNWARRDGVQH